MRRVAFALSLALVFAAALALPAFAGEGKCTAGTQECLNYMAENLKNKGWVGIEYEENESTSGLTVVKVISGSPAETSGLEIGDVLTEMNGEALPIKDEAAMKAAKKLFVPGATLKYTVTRNGETKKIPITLASMPEHVIAEWIGRHMLDHVDIAKK